MEHADLHAWFRTVELSGDIDSDYAHVRMLQAEMGGWQVVRDKLIALLERAHSDARTYFHTDLCLSLDPYDTSLGSYAYPKNLPLETQLGYFGEAFCAMISEGMELVGKRSWTVPVFLFRIHNQAEEYLHRLIYGEPVSKGIPGRTGSDFIALCLDDRRHVQAFLAGEAKCHETFNITKAQEALTDLGEQSPIPRSLGQLKRVLSDNNLMVWRDTIQSIERILLTKTPVPRTDLFVYIFEKPGTTHYSSPRITKETKTKYHRCQRPLHVAEVHIPDARLMVSALYEGLYRKEGASDAAT